jgi:hypothetical protein
MMSHAKRTPNRPLASGQQPAKKFANALVSEILYREEFPSPTATETLMTRTDILQRLQTIKEKGTQALRLLESKPLSVDTQTEIRSLAQ